MRNGSPEQMIVNTTLGLKPRGTLDADLRNKASDQNEQCTSRANKMENPSKQVFGNLTYKNVETLGKLSNLPSGFFPLKGGGLPPIPLRVFGQNDFR